jgi:hypothetical protein
VFCNNYPLHIETILRLSQTMFNLLKARSGSGAHTSSKALRSSTHNVEQRAITAAELGVGVSPPQVACWVIVLSCVVYLVGDR